MELDPGEVVGDRYTVESRLGEGGMAVVYKVLHHQLGTHHALKVLSLNSRSVRDRMLQEGRFQAKLQHPNIVAVTDVVAIHESPALVMELVDGPPLDELLRMQKLTLDQADAIGRGILAAVAHAHGLGLIHRDLKPANVLLQIVGQTAIPKVTDFGLAKLLVGQEGRAATRTGSTMGTPQYMSPEQIKDTKSVDERSDVFALGAILYELVTGDRAFDGENVLAIFSAVDAGTYVAPETLRPDLPERMKAAIEAGLQTDREKRAPSAKALYALWTGGEELTPHSTASATLGTLPSFSQFDEEPSPPTGMGFAPALMLGGSFLALGAAVVVILALLLVVGLLLNRPAEEVVIERPVVVQAPVETPTVAPMDAPVDAPEDTDTPDEPPMGQGVPWNELVGPDGEVLTEPEVSPRDEPDPPEPAEPVEKSDIDVLIDETLATRGERRVAGLFKIGQQWEKGPGDVPEHRVAEVLRKCPTARIPLLKSYSVRGISLQPPAPYLSAERSRATRGAALRAIVDIANRQGTQAEALRLLEDYAHTLKKGQLEKAREDLSQ